MGEYHKHARTQKRVGPSYGESIHGPKRIIRQRFGSGWGRGLPYGACACFSGFYGSAATQNMLNSRPCGSAMSFGWGIIGRIIEDFLITD